MGAYHLEAVPSTPLPHLPVGYQYTATRMLSLGFFFPFSFCSVRGGDILECRRLALGVYR